MSYNQAPGGATSSQSREPFKPAPRNASGLLFLLPAIFLFAVVVGAGAYAIGTGAIGLILASQPDPDYSLLFGDSQQNTGSGSWENTRTDSSQFGGDSFTATYDDSTRIEEYNTTTLDGSSLASPPTLSPSQIAVPGVRAGQDPYLLLDTNSKNISCEIHESYAACSILERHYQKAGLNDCSQRLFSIMIADGSPTLVCGNEYLGKVGDPVYHMQYGETVTDSTFGNYSCKAQESGVSCWNVRTGKGFKIRREGYALIPNPSW